MKKYKHCITVLSNVPSALISIISNALLVYYEKMMNVVIDSICSSWKFSNDDKNHLCPDILRKPLHKSYQDHTYGA